MLLRTQPTGLRFDFGAELIRGVNRELNETAFKAFQRGIIGEPPFTNAEIGRIQAAAFSIVVQGFVSQLTALSLVHGRDEALGILEGWKLSLGLIRHTKEYDSLVCLLQSVIDADPVFRIDPFNGENEALRRLVRIGLNQFVIIHESYIEEIVDYALSDDPLEEDIGVDEETSVRYKANLVREFKEFVKQIPNVVGDQSIAREMLVELAISARLSVDLARKTSKGHTVNFLNRLLGSDEKPDSDGIVS